MILGDILGSRKKLFPIILEHKCGQRNDHDFISSLSTFSVDCDNADSFSNLSFFSSVLSLFLHLQTISMATTLYKPTSPFAPSLSLNYPSPLSRSLSLLSCPKLPLKLQGHEPFFALHCRYGPSRIVCKATEVSMAEGSSASGGGGGGGDNWVPVVPLSALPKGERRVIIQDGETILLLWYKNELFAIENRSPAEGAYSEGLINAKLTQDGCIVCPSTDSTFDLRNGSIREWYPNNPVLRVLTPPLRSLFVYPVKTDEENIYISIKGGPKSDASAEIVFSGRAQPGFTATDVNVDEVRMVVDEDQEGFGFTGKNEIINGKAAVIGFLLLLDFELLTGKGLLKGTGFLDFLYSVTNAFQ